MINNQKENYILTLTICGGGNGALTAAAYISSKPTFRVNVLTRRPKEWSKTLKIDTSICSWEMPGDILGHLNKVSDDPSELIGESDVVVLALPANAHFETLRKIKPYLRKDVIVGTIFAQGGFDWIANAAFDGDLSKISALFGLQNIPWLCRIKHYGKEATLIGPKRSLSVAAFPPERTNLIAELILYMFDINTVPLPNFLSLTLTPSNQIIHPARYYSIFRNWDGERPMQKHEIQWGLYTEIDDTASLWMEKLDSELQNIKSALVSKFSDLDLSGVLPLQHRIIKQYGKDVVDRTNLKTVIASNKGYAGCITPVENVEGGFIPALKSRLFWEDIPYGLCILKNIAELLEIETPSIDFMIEWHQRFMNKKYIINGKLNPELISETGAPVAYGIKTLEELVAFSLPSYSSSFPSNFLESFR